MSKEALIAALEFGRQPMLWQLVLTYWRASKVRWALLVCLAAVQDYQPPQKRLKIGSMVLEEDFRDVPLVLLVKECEVGEVVALLCPFAP